MALTPLPVTNANGAVANQEMLQGATGNNMVVVSTDSTRITYRASANFTPLATAAVTLIQITGSATKTVRIKRILIGGVSTALSASVLQLIRCSASGTGGTGVSPTISLLDRGALASYAAATAVVKHFTTAAQSAGTSTGFGPLSTQLITTSTVTTPTVALAGTPQAMFPEFGSPIGSAIVLRGVTDFLEVQNVTPTNLGAGTVLTYMVEFEEDNS